MNKGKRLLLSWMLCALAGAAQNQPDLPVQTDFRIMKAATVTFSALGNDHHPSLLIREMPRQGGRPTTAANESFPGRTSYKYSVTVPPPTVGQSFFGNEWGFSTPNDNDFAISDSGMALSVINTNIYVRNTRTGTTYTTSLAKFTQPVNNYHREFDPKVIYDPVKDRFAIVIMVGTLDSTSNIVVGFSKTSDPSGAWNLYMLPGDPLNAKLWSDYPMIAMTEKELFLTVNLLYNDSTWQKGFVQTIVWQIKKDSGYAGLPLGSKLHSNIKFVGKMIRNLCPVKGGSRFYGPSMYFLSNRNLAVTNDSVFIFKITDTIGAPGLTITRQVVKASTPYVFPPDGRQTASSQSLATNDCRNLGAFIENGIIQYVHNTKNPQNGRCSIYYGVISSPGTSSAVVNGYIIDNDTMDFGYPNISYSGVNSSDNGAIITFNHSSLKVAAGVSAVQADGTGAFSPVVRIHTGTTFINLLQDNLERWGDYSGSQRLYARPGEVWMSGYHSYLAKDSIYTYRAHGAWIAQIFTDEAMRVGLPSFAEQDNGRVYPVPVSGNFMVDISLKRPEYLNIELYDITGRLVTPLYREMVTAPESTFVFGPGGLTPGTYFVKITGNSGTAITRKIIVNQ